MRKCASEQRLQRGTRLNTMNSSCLGSLCSYRNSLMGCLEGLNPFTFLFNAAVTTVVLSPFFSFCTPNTVVTKINKIRFDVCVNEMAPFGAFSALIKGCISFSSSGRNGNQPTRYKCSPLRYMGFPKISCLFVLCVVCNRRRSYLPRIVRLGVVRSRARH